MGLRPIRKALVQGLRPLGFPLLQLLARLQGSLQLQIMPAAGFLFQNILFLKQPDPLAAGSGLRPVGRCWFGPSGLHLPLSQGSGSALSGPEPCSLWAFGPFGGAGSALRACTSSKLLLFYKKKQKSTHKRVVFFIFLGRGYPIPASNGPSGHVGLLKLGWLGCFATCQASGSQPS